MRTRKRQRCDSVPDRAFGNDNKARLKLAELSKTALSPSPIAISQCRMSSPVNVSNRLSMLLFRPSDRNLAIAQARKEAHARLDRAPGHEHAPKVY
jgi:hypothetical protein